MIREFIKKYWLLSSIITGLLLAYIYAMVIAPYETGDWTYVQHVWSRWQSFNAAMIALFSGLIFFSASRFIEHRNHINKARAARAFLSHQLSHIISFCDDNIRRLIPVMLYLESRNAPESNTTDPAPEYYYVSCGTNYFPFFKDCIELDNPELGKALSELLHSIQVTEARLSSLRQQLQDSSTFIPVFQIYSQIIDLFEVKAKAGKRLKYVRDREDKSVKTKSTREEIITTNSFLLLDHAELARVFNQEYPEVTKINNRQETEQH